MRDSKSSARIDADLVRRARAGEAAAFEALVDRHLGAVHTVAWSRLRQREAAEDLAQEVFVRAHLHLARLRDPGRFGAWVCQMARNLATDWLRRGQRQSTLLSLIPLPDESERPMPSDDPTPRERLEEEESIAEMHRALDRLNPESREIVLLHFAQGLTQREIAERLGLSHPTVCRRLARALDQMRGALAPALKSPRLGALPRKGLATRTAALVAAVAASAEVKAAVAGAAVSAQTAGEVSGSVTSGVGLLAGLKGLITTGGQIMALNKGAAAITAVAIVAVGGGIAITKGDGRPTARSTPPAAVENTTSAMDTQPPAEGLTMLSARETELQEIYRRASESRPFREDPYAGMKAVLGAMTDDDDPADLLWLFPHEFPRPLAETFYNENFDPRLQLQMIRGRELLGIAVGEPVADGTVATIRYIDAQNREIYLDAFVSENGLWKHLLPNVPEEEFGRIIEMAGIEIRNGQLVGWGNFEEFSRRVLAGEVE